MQKETIELLEQNVQDSLRKVNELDVGDDNRSDTVKEACLLMDKLLSVEHEKNEKMKAQRNRSIEKEKMTLEQDQLDFNREKSKEELDLERERLEYDREKVAEAQTIDRERITVEHEKNEMPTWKIALEVAKLAIPVVSGVMSIVAYDKFQKRMFDFEENGHICSTAGRELHLPKFWK